MSTSTLPSDPSPVPVFADTRTLAEKLACERREWRPHQPEQNCPSTIFGLVLERDKYVSKYDNKEPRESALILTTENVLWSVVAFHGYLQSEFQRRKPQVGDFVAIAYRGTKPAKRSGENDAHDYALEVERNPKRAEQTIDGASQPTEPVPTHSDPSFVEVLPSFSDDDGDAA